MLRLNKTKNVYFNSTKSNEVDIDNIKAFSYTWWQYLTVIGGKVVFNNYSYSPTTSKHQNDALKLLEQNGIKIDIFMNYTEKSLFENYTAAAILDEIKCLIVANNELHRLVNSKKTKEHVNEGRSKEILRNENNLIELTKLLKEF